MHIQNIHSKPFQFKLCDKSFDTRYKLEDHLQEQNDMKEFKCDICDSEFYLEWCLKKHLRGHSDVSRKCCHYFNNEKDCLYQEIGCKFKQEVSGLCSFGQSCWHYLCQYQHKKTVDKKDEDVIDNTSVEDHENIN